MIRYEYKVVPAPAKGLKARGVKGPEARFANALETLMNQMGTQGWDYQRADILPSSERQGLTSSQIVYRNILVFRRPLAEETPAGDVAPVTADISEQDATDDTDDTDDDAAAGTGQPDITPDPEGADSAEITADDETRAEHG